VGWCEAADGGDEGEEEVLGDEAPGEQADDGADLAADDRAEPTPIAPQSAVPAMVPSSRRVIWLPVRTRWMPRPASAA
jgi:hypothetical protein